MKTPWMLSFPSDRFLIVDGLPRMIHGQARCHWWNDDLEQMRDAVRRLRRITTRDTSRRDDYILARNVYRSLVVQARYNNLKTMLATTKDPDIFRYVHTMHNSRSLPAMDKGDGTFCLSHSNISDLIASQLNPFPLQEWIPYMYDDIGNTVSEHCDDAIRTSSSNTATLFDHMSNPFIRLWRRQAPDSFKRCIK